MASVSVWDIMLQVEEGRRDITTIFKVTGNGKGFTVEPSQGDANKVDIKASYNYGRFEEIVAIIPASSSEVAEKIIRLYIEAQEKEIRAEERDRAMDTRNNPEPVRRGPMPYFP